MKSVPMSHVSVSNIINYLIGVEFGSRTGEIFMNPSIFSFSSSTVYHKLRQLSSRSLNRFTLFSPVPSLSLH